MLSIVPNNWYTDRMDVYRVQDIKEKNLTKKERVPVLSGVPCRVYSSKLGGITATMTSARVECLDKVSCGVDADIQTGDELHITRGAAVGGSREPERYFAGDIQVYYEPFGGVAPQLQHQQIAVTREERVGGGKKAGAGYG